MRSLLSFFLVAFALLGCDSSSSSSSTAADTQTSAADTGGGNNNGADTATSSGPDLANGEKVAKQVCGACHGGDLKGGSNFGGCIAADMYELSAEGWSVDNIISSLRDGVDDEGAQLCSTMPRYTESQLSTKDAGDIAAYLLTLK